MGRSGHEPQQGETPLDPRKNPSSCEGGQGPLAGSGAGTLLPQGRGAEGGPRSQRGRPSLGPHEQGERGRPRGRQPRARRDERAHGEAAVPRANEEVGPASSTAMCKQMRAGCLAVHSKTMQHPSTALPLTLGGCRGTDGSSDREHCT